MSFQQGLSGLNSASKTLDVIGNNVANAGTVGFKQSQAQFSDVFANTLSGSGGTQIGIGTRLATVAQLFSQGNISVTNNPLDLAVNGKGFFRMDNNGAISYSRNGQFQLDKSGYIVNGAGLRLTGYLANTSGAISTAAAAPLQIPSNDLTPQVTSRVNAVFNLDSRNTTLSAAFDITDPTTYNNSTSVAVYDSLGNSHTLSMYFVKSAANTWEVFAANDGVQIDPLAPGVAGDPVGTLTFNSNGNIDTTATTIPFVISAPVTTGATTPLAFNLDYTGTTQFGSSFGVNSLAQDGYTSGRLSGFSVAADGMILGRYTNGQSATLGQVVLTNFTNPQGLQPLGDNGWAETSSSGVPLIGGPGTGSLGALQSAAVEDSNVDLTAELVNMITAQRIYQANAQSIKTQDAVLQTLVNLR